MKREVRFCLHIPRGTYNDDALYVKEQITYDSNEMLPNTYVVYNYKRPVWVTKPSYRNNKSKKEFEDMDKLIKIETTESDIYLNVAKALGKPYLANNEIEIRNSPYVYGLDQTVTSLYKLESLKNNSFIQSPYTVAAFDLEATIGDQVPIVISSVFKKDIVVSVLGSFLDDTKKIEKAFRDYLPDYIDYNLHIHISDDPIYVIKKVFDFLNEKMPDFLAIWNMDYDIPTILGYIRSKNKNPKDILCDPRIDKNLRVCYYKQGKKKKITFSKVVKPINPSLQWHTLYLTAPFYVIDSMCCYRQIRIHQQEEPSYSLDYILNKELNKSKLKFNILEGIGGYMWHKVMQEKYRPEYVIYNIFDSIGILELDYKLKDLSHTLPSAAGMTDFSKFNSNPKRIMDALYIFGLKKDKVIATSQVPEYKINDKDIDDDIDDTEDKEDETDDELKYETLGLKGWIQLLPQNLLKKEGLKVIEEFPNQVTNIRGLVVDLDSVSSYPTCINVANVSKETTFTEVIKITNIDETYSLRNDVLYDILLGFCFGECFAIEFFSRTFNMPRLEYIYDILNMET
ncbi:MAG: hypothetical protein QXF12_03410 [Candidatus Aenigmatarchaeota archaeon]